MFHNQTIFTNIPVTYNYDVMIARDTNLLNKVCMTIPVKNRLEQQKRYVQEPKTNVYAF